MTEHTLSEADYDAITDAAAHWCMRLHAADCTPAEREAFARWLAAHPMHAFEYEAIQEVWDIADHLPRPHTEHITPAAAPVLPARPRRSRRGSPRMIRSRRTSPTPCRRRAQHIGSAPIKSGAMSFQGSYTPLASISSFV